MKRKTPMSERLFRRFMYKYYARYLLVDLQMAAKRDTLDYIQKNMSDALLFNDRWDLLEFAVERAADEGLMLEFGVQDGRSLRHIAGLTDRTVHGFDSFEGLPEDWAGTFERRGKFTRRGRLPKVPGNAQLHVGWFDETLPHFTETHPGGIALLHVDCDIYSSTRTVFSQLGGRLAPGSVIVFDEYFNYPNWREHEFKAFREFVADSGVKYEYAGFCIKDGHVMVRIV